MRMTGTEKSFKEWVNSKVKNAYFYRNTIRESDGRYSVTVPELNMKWVGDAKDAVEARILAVENYEKRSKNPVTKLGDSVYRKSNHPNHAWYVEKLVKSQRVQDWALNKELRRDLQKMSKVHRDNIMKDFRDSYKKNPKARKKNPMNNKFSDSIKHFQAAAEFESQINQITNEALKNYGDHGQLISGVVRDHFPEITKKTLRELHRLKNNAVDMGFKAKPSRVHDKTMQKLYKSVMGRNKNPIKKNPKINYYVIPITQAQESDLVVEHGGVFRLKDRKISEAHKPDHYGETVYFKGEYLGPYLGSTVAIPRSWFNNTDRPWIIQGNRLRSVTVLEKGAKWKQTKSRKKNPQKSGPQPKKSGKISIGDKCKWFALCENKATTTEPHPILGDVPICQRCKDKVERLSNPRKNKVFKKRTYNATYYFPTYGDAKEYAQTHGFPDDRIIGYQRGYAIQLRVSGPYVGPGSVPQARKQNPLFADWYQVATWSESANKVAWHTPSGFTLLRKDAKHMDRDEAIKIANRHASEGLKVVAVTNDVSLAKIKKALQGKA